MISHRREDEGYSLYSRGTAKEEDTMHATLVNDRKRLVWTEVPDPIPNPNEILVEIHAAALNRADLMQRAGDYPPPPG